MLVIPLMGVAPGLAPLRDNPAAFRAFYDDALPRVYGYFFHRCGCKVAVAEDLTQETFLAAVSELKKGRPVEHPVAWVLGIARHKLLDHYRREERETRKLTAVQQAESIADEALVRSGEASRERALEALGAVAGSQRAALVLRYLDGFSVPEIADTLGRSVEATESLLARGRESFKRAYVEEGDG